MKALLSGGLRRRGCREGGYLRVTPAGSPPHPGLKGQEEEAGLQHLQKPPCPGSEHACAQELGGTWTRLAKSPCEPGQDNQDSVPALGCLPAPGRTGPPGLVWPHKHKGGTHWW